MDNDSRITGFRAVHPGETLAEELKERGITLPAEEEPVTKRVIHTSADFEYAQTMCYSKSAVQVAREAKERQVTRATVS